ncbi:MAG: hypothetical protein ABI462_03365 [Ignavibacteria bacterium]
MKEFDKFISSPLFGCKNFVIRFFKEIKKHYPEFSPDDIEKEKIFKKLYGSKKYNDGLVRRMTSDLMRMSEDFMMYSSFRATESFRNVCFLHELRLRKLDDIFLIKSGRLLSEIKNSSIDNLSLMNKFFIENQRINLFIKGKENMLLESLFAGSDALIGFFLSALNNKTQVIHGRRRATKTGTEPVLYDNFMKHFDYPGYIKSIETVDTAEAFFLKANYYFHLMSIDKDDVESYQKCRQLVHTDSTHLRDVSRQNYILSLANFCSGQVMDNNYDYLDEYFYNIEIILKENLFLSNATVISPGIIRRIILFSMIQKQAGYIENFVKDYSKYFNPMHKDDLINYCNAAVHFVNKDFGKALEHSSMITHLPSEFIKDIKILKIKIFYILNYSDSFISEIDSFRHYLSTENGFNERNILKGRNFIKFILKLSKLRDNRLATDLSVLIREIMDEDKINEKLWLVESANEL